MIELTRGDILNAEAEALVNTVNCVGVMGRGIALQFRKAFPDNFKVYKAACDRKALYPGKMLVYDLNRFENPRYVINFPTKRHWRGKSHMEDVEAGLTALVDEIVGRGIKSVALPPLGCGLGGLDWQDVRQHIERAFKNHPYIHVLLYEPVGTPTAAAMPKVSTVPTMTVARATLVGLIRRYLAGLMDASITLLEIHKLMYFMQESGEDLQLQYQKAAYGPYADNLRHLLNAVEGHFISGFGDGEDAPDKEIELVPKAVELSDMFLEKCPETKERFDRVINLISGFESAFGMELLSTVHWVGGKEQATTQSDAMAKIYAWNDRKRMFAPKHIEVALGRLQTQGWLR